MSKLIEYEDYLIREKEELKKIITLLIRQTFILSKKYDSNKEKMVSNNEYKIALNYLSFLRGYFEVMGAKLCEDEANGIIYLDGCNFKTYNLSKMEVIYLLIIKLIYEEKQEVISIDKSIFITLEEINYKISVLKLLDTLPSQTTRVQALKSLKKYQLIDKILGNYEREATFIVYPSIESVLNNQDINTILSRMNKDKDNEKVKNNN